MENLLNAASTTKADRKLVERDRRNKMKALSCMLNSLVPKQSSRELNSMSDQLHEATNHIKKLHIKLEQMKEKKKKLVEIQRRTCYTNGGGGGGGGGREGSKSPKIEIQQMGLTLVVSLITGLDCQFMMLKETIRILGDEGADIVSANYTVSKDSVFHTIHCQVEESSNGERMSERLKRFIEDSSYICAF